MVLCIVDATGIQDYIFGSNRLQENLGASFLVAQATGSWVKECLPRPHNLTPDGQVDPDRRLEADEKQKSELLYSGGGNAVVLLRDDSPARAFAGALSRKVLSEAPGLELAIYFEEVEFAELNATVMSRVQEGLAA
ncbi:MAG: hypothetical protein HUU35_19735, partial [Armatimonadetes bacterium]|nr:hypothetical protein [Armatimonadota bacterium]